MVRQSKFNDSQITAPAIDAFAITASDATVFGDTAATAVTRGIYVGVTGDINIVTDGGSTVLFSNVPVGVLPVRAKQVLSTSTTASSMVGLV